jgi:hypothetical protein
MLSISENISDEHIQKIFFGSGVAYDLAKLHTFDEMYKLDSHDREKIVKILRTADIFVNVMDFPMGRLVKEARCVYFLIDSLLWFWSSLPEGVQYADIYFCQNFFCPVESKIQAYKLKNAKVIGPIINNNFKHFPKKDQVIINFGGLENPYIEIGSNSNYPFIMLTILFPILQTHFSSILVTGRERVMEMCRSRFSETKSLRFRNLSQREMLEELCQSVALLTAPGIQTFYDASDKVPIFCLPPQNDSNIRNLDILVEHKVIKHYLTWRDLYEFPVNTCKTITEIFELLLHTLKIFEATEQDQKILQARVLEFLHQQDTWEDLIRVQKEAVERLGENGVQVVKKAIYEVLYPPSSSIINSPWFFYYVLFNQKI